MAENLNEENTIPILGIIEEYLGYIMISLAHHHEESFTNLTQIPLDKLEEKSFDLPPTSISNIMDLKDLYEDEELDEYRNPISLNEFKQKARLILDSKNPECSKAFLNGFRSRTPKEMPSVMD